MKKNSKESERGVLWKYRTKTKAKTRFDFAFILCHFVLVFLCFSVLLVLRLPRLGKRELILVLFVRLFGLCLFRFVGFLSLLGSGKGCGL